MKVTAKTFLIALAGLGSILLFGLTASAECGYYGKPALHPNSYQPQSFAPQFLTIGDPDGTPTMVGVWKERWISQGNQALGIPNGADVDAVYSVWHSDGTEVNISGLRAPRTGDVCMGVWEKIGPLTYKLNHFGISYNPDDTLLGLAHIQQTLVLDSEGNAVTGTFTIDQYDESGDLLAHIKGIVQGTRVTINTGWQRVE
ncbi:MAG TPA: hypothetical protein VME86_00070 [Acidobacteriaceae bacterium]|nr:hypothetical protein [Acidobacteriaceae bacterium]